MPGHSHRVAPGYDPERARDLLVEAGYFQRQRDPVVIAELESTARLGAELVAQLDEVGVSAELRDVPFPEIAHLDEMADAWLTGWLADYPDPDAMLGRFVAFITVSTATARSNSCSNGRAHFLTGTSGSSCTAKRSARGSANRSRSFRWPTVDS
jgi:ABC-type transport system substrate-binding protein